MGLRTTRERVAQMRDHGFMTDADLVNTYIFFIKLALYFEDPFRRFTNTFGLLELFLGQKSMEPLWQMMMGHKYRTIGDLLALKVRYDFKPPRHPEFEAMTIIGIPPNQVGQGHLEQPADGGLRRGALMCLRQLAARELVRRGLDLRGHIFHLILWGHIDHASGRNLYPSEDEIYMDDSGYANRKVDTSDDVKPWHCLERKWGGRGAVDAVRADADSQAAEPGPADHAPTHAYAGSWETNINAQLRRVAESARSTRSGRRPCERMETPTDTDVATGDSLGDNLSRLLLERNGLVLDAPEYGSGDMSDRTGRFQFPPGLTVNHDTQLHEPRSESLNEQGAWDNIAGHFDEYWGAPSHNA
ncbi:hypothetical protein SAMD00023353_0600060 [Rosellinia necatrix]|uniref:Uncharacterized protein n=1 Tax=Rosellinia necatrix TaxID=77044 RepID=A0A1S8A5M1_ROSNE|nr:hypothetical protein SAMD00023353_0600060 [Rosellinia necatrix]